MKQLVLMVILLLALQAPLTANEPAEVHVIVQLDGSIDAISALEFRIDNLPSDQCLIVENWATELVIGDLGWDISIAFIEPQPGPLIYVGTLVFIAHEDVGPDYYMQVQQGNDCDCLVVVDEDFNTLSAYGGAHTFNCTDPDDSYWLCRCFPIVQPREVATIGLYVDMDATLCYQDLPMIGTPSKALNWGSIKSLY